MSPETYANDFECMEGYPYMQGHVYLCVFFFLFFVLSECSRPFIEMKILVGLRLCIFFSIIFFILLATLVSCSVCVQRIAETSKEGE